MLHLLFLSYIACLEAFRSVQLYNSKIITKYNRFVSSNNIIIRKQITSIDLFDFFQSRSSTNANIQLELLKLAREVVQIVKDREIAVEKIGKEKMEWEKQKYDKEFEFRKVDIDMKKVDIDFKKVDIDLRKEEFDLKKISIDLKKRDFNRKDFDSKMKLISMVLQFILGIIFVFGFSVALIEFGAAIAGKPVDKFIDGWKHVSSFFGFLFGVNSISGTALNTKRLFIA